MKKYPSPFSAKNIQGSRDIECIIGNSIINMRKEYLSPETESLRIEMEATLATSTDTTVTPGIIEDDITGFELF